MPLPALPTYLYVFFYVIVLLSIYLLYRNLQHSQLSVKLRQLTLLGVILWLGMQYGLASQGIYISDISAPPANAPLLLGPPLLLIALLFTFKASRQFLSSLSLEELSYISIVRIPVEFCLYALFLYKAIPEVMTFAGRNYDILAGLTAPLVGYFVFRKGRWPLWVAKIWAVGGLVLLLNIIAHAILSVNSSWQQFGFDQPNLVLQHQPFIWLPCFIVVLVLWSHVVIIWRLWRR